MRRERARGASRRGRAGARREEGPPSRSPPPPGPAVRGHRPPGPLGCIPDGSGGRGRRGSQPRRLGSVAAPRGRRREARWERLGRVWGRDSRFASTWVKVDLRPKLRAGSVSNSNSNHQRFFFFFFNFPCKPAAFSIFLAVMHCVSSLSRCRVTCSTSLCVQPFGE